MSFENLNAENRNQIFTPYPIRRQMCCSFCRLPNHNRRSCVYATINTTTYREFEAICARKVLDTNTQEEFKNWLTNNYSQEQDLLRGFILNKFRYITVEPIISITEYIFNTYKVQDDDVFTENDLRQFIAELDEIIPFQEFEEVRAMESILTRDYIEFIMNGSYIILSIKNNENENINDNCECSICLDEKEIKNFVKLGCNHEFCKDCIIKMMKSCHTNLRCALCRTQVKSITSRENSVNDELSKFVA